MSNLKKDIVVLGAGSYGTALSLHWHKMQKSVALVPRSSEQVDLITKDQENKRYLENIDICGLPVIFDYSLCLNAKVIVIAIPSQEYRNFLPKIVPFIGKESTIVIASKGIDIKTNSFLKDVVEEFCINDVGIWSGPQFAKEVANLLPSAVTLASEKEDTLEKLVPLLGTHTLRVYPTEDVISVQLSGALKNVIALACGIARGKNLGENTIAALITRGLSEIRRLGVEMGGDLETYLGLSALGDLVLTCSSLESRNTQFGISLAQESNLQSLLDSPRPLAEGVFTAKAAHYLSQKYNVYMPITSAIYRLLYEGCTIDFVIDELLSTKPKWENN